MPDDHGAPRTGALALRKHWVVQGVPKDKYYLYAHIDPRRTGDWLTMVRDGLHPADNWSRNR
jgi:hypothetical protein